MPLRFSSALAALTAIALTFSLAFAAAPSDAQLQALLERHPAADTNRDGTLSLAEARAYQKIIRARKSTAPAGTSVATTDADDTGAARPSRNKPAPTHADIRYGPHERNTLDLWLAPSATPTPLVVYIHGGGFINGSKAGASADMIKGCLEAGVSFMAINYRYRTTAPIQDVFRDCARSLQFVRHHASRYDIDPRRIASYGGSAGAGTSLWLAFHDDLADPQNPDPILRESSRLAAAAATNAQATYHLLRWKEFLGTSIDAYERPGETASFYGAKSDAELDTPAIQAAMRDADMLAHISKDDPPVFLFAAQPDGPVSSRGHLLHHPRHATIVKQRCDELGVPATVYYAKSEPRLEGDYQPKLREFLLQHLK